MIPTVIGLGRLVEIVIRDAQERRLRLTPQGEHWMAWNPTARDLLILRPGRGEAEDAPRADAERHRAFHGADPRQARPMEWPAPRGAVRPLGLIESVTYVATGIRSPRKGAHHWIHHFGDCGERGHGSTQTAAVNPYPQRYMPRLDVDQTGNLYLIRRPGNRFTVRNWIIG